MKKYEVVVHRETYEVWHVMAEDATEAGLVYEHEGEFIREKVLDSGIDVEEY